MMALFDVLQSVLVVWWSMVCHPQGHVAELLAANVSNPC